MQHPIAVRYIQRCILVRMSPRMSPPLPITLYRTNTPDRVPTVFTRCFRIRPN